MDGFPVPSYRRIMTRGIFRIRAIALAAAYALALQGLLAAFVPVALALPGELCSGQSIDGPAAPSSHESSCASACVLLGGASAPPPPDIVAAVRVAVRAANTIFFGAVLLTAAPRGPQTARAPPIV